MQELNKLLKKYDITDRKNGEIICSSPVNGSLLATIKETDTTLLTQKIERSKQAFEIWREVPAPVRGNLVRILGEELRREKEDLGRLVTIECGKILQEGLGEVQEMIDICDFAVGLSRQLYGKTFASERPGHHMRELWHPLGPVAIITAFNFPVAVWAWNAALALVCGDSLLWKPSEKTPLTAIACEAIFKNALKRFEEETGTQTPENLLQLILGGRTHGEVLAASPEIPLVSATGSVPMGRAVAQTVASRLGRSLLELGGNNAMIVCPSADPEMTLRAVLFGAVGTAGQRCTSLRRLFLHRNLAKSFTERLVSAYAGIRVGNPLDPETLVGPLIDEGAFHAMQSALESAKAQGGEILYGGERVTQGVPEGGVYVRPAIVRMPGQSDIVRQETFAPILYLLEWESFEEVVSLHNDVPQGLSSCIFTQDLREAERFLSATGSDCGIANVNIGTSGAEIGGAFGGEKETGGGRESGSGSWKAYMRRQTQTVNFSDAMPLAQGIVFGTEDE